MKKAGPFDHTPQRPQLSKTLKYFEAQEGLLAMEADPLLQGTKLTRKDLPPQKPVQPASAGEPCLLVLSVPCLRIPHSMCLQMHAVLSC